MGRSLTLGLPRWLSGKAPTYLAMHEMQKIQAQSLGWEDPPGEGMATQFSILAWEISRTVLED